MTTLTETEAKVYKILLECETVNLTAASTCYCRNTITKYVSHFIRLGLLIKLDSGRYRGTGAEYKVKKNPPPKKKEPKQKVIRIKPMGKIPSHVTDEQITYITGHYDKMPRRKLAERVGLSKIDLNQTIISLGLSVERMEAYAEGDLTA